MLQRGFLSLIIGITITGARPMTAAAQPLVSSQPATLPALVSASDESKDSVLLAADPFISEATGVSFNPPVGCKNLGSNDGQYVASYSDDSRKWLLRVTEATFPNPVQLLTVKDNDQHPVQGLLAYTVAQLKAAEPGGEILRGEAGDDVVNVGAYSVGLIAMRYVQSGQTWLRQQAMVEVNDQLYYIFSLVTPGGNGDDQEKTAVETFSALIDTIKVLDRSQIKEDQNQRLYRTRALFLYWTRDKFNSILIPKQYFRILKNGKDVGYTFTEELSDRPDLVEITNPGVIAFERTAVVESNTAGITRQTGAEIFRFISYDRKFEQWTRTVLLHLTTPKGLEESYATEFGNSFQERKRAFSKDIGVPDPKDPHGPATREYEVHHLDVTVSGKDQNTEPVHKELPPFYLPQAGWHFLPRLVVDKSLSNDSPRTYLFAVYVTDKRAIMMLYVDVSAEQEVVFAGRQVHAVTVTERLGLQGNPVVHYVTPDGKYLGSEDRKAHLVTVASTDHEVTAIWPTADYTLPQKAKLKHIEPEQQNLGASHQ